jgi:tetratricopeptide (TPR) repeat protein
LYQFFGVFIIFAIIPVVSFVQGIDAKSNLNSASSNVSSDIQIKQASICIKKGEYAKAIEYFNKALKLNPSSIKAYIGRGYVYNIKGDSEKAVSDFSQAIKIAPGSVDAYLNRGAVFESQGEYDKAAADYIIVTKLSPKSHFAYFCLGNVYFEKKDYNRSINFYTKAIELNPKYAEAYNSRGAAYKKIWQQAKAKEDFKKAEALTRSKEKMK